MNLNVTDLIAGSTVKATWINSGQTPSAIECFTRNSSYTIVNSFSVQNSGDGHYYAQVFLPSSPNEAWYLNEWLSVINANTYRSVQLLHAATPKVGG